MKKEYFTSLPALVVYWIALTLVAMAPYVFFGRFLLPGADAVAYHYPAFYWFSESLKSGQSFLWNPGFLSGFPMYLSQVGGFFDPINILLFKYTPSFLLAYHLRLVLDYVLVMVFSYLVAREWKVSKIAAFFVGPAYLLAMHWWYLSTMHFANSLFILPFLFWVYMRARNTSTFPRRIGWGVLGGVGLGWSFIGGYAQFIVYSLTFLGLFAVSDFLWILERSQRTFRRAIELICVLGVIALVGGIVGLPQILPSMAYVPYSIRASGVPYDMTQLKVLGIKELVFFIFPDYLRFPFLTGGKKSLYIGGLSFLLACFSVLYFKKNPLVQVLFGIFAFAFILALPGSLLYYLMHKLPVFDLFRYPSRWFFNGIWVFAVLGALGFDMLREPITDKRSRYFSIIVSFGMIALSCFVLACTVFGEWFWGPVKDFGIWLFSNTVYSPDTFPKELQHYEGALQRGVDAWRDVASFTNLPFTIPFVALMAAWVGVTLRVYQKISWKHFQIIGVVIFTATFIGIFAARWPDTLPGSVFFNNRSTAEAFIPSEQLRMYRVHPFHPGYMFQPRHTSLIWSTEDTVAGVELQESLLTPNSNVFGGVLLTDGYEPFISPDLLHVFAVLLASTYSSQDELKDVTYDDRRNLLLEHLDIVGMMGGRYILSGMTLESPDLKLLGVPRASRYETPFYVYEYAKALPRAYLARKTESSPHNTVRELVEADKHFLQTTYLDCGTCGDVRIVPGTLTVDAIENGYFDLKISAKSAQWLVLSEHMLPGWIIEVDGVEVDPVRANGMYMAISIPAGEHRVIAQYEGMLGEARWLKPFGLFPYSILSE